MRKLRLAFAIRGRRVVGEFDLATATATLTISPRVAPAVQAARPPSTAPGAVTRPPPEKERVPVAQSLPAREEAERAPPSEPPPAPPPARETLKDAASVARAGSAERDHRERKAPRARWRRQAAYAAATLAAAGLALLGVIAASRLAATDSADRAQAPPPPTRTLDDRQRVSTTVSTKPPTRAAAPTASTTPGVRSRKGTTRADQPRTDRETTAIPPQPPAGTLVEPVVLRWAPSPNATVYWFELYRRGRLGASKILEAWPVEPHFTIPVRAPDGTWLGPGRYDWSASPQEARGARVRYTALGEAGRFVIRQDGRIDLHPR
jgi:hypothetical protein